MSEDKSDPLAGLPAPRDVIADMARRNPVFLGLGIEVLLAERGLSRFAMVVRPDMGNTFGVCHGGVYFTLADLCLGFTCNAARNERAVTA
ncbi:MAG: PaaI family thioesterase, partial [Hyphomicrobiaceae bacterium]